MTSPSDEEFEAFQIKLSRFLEKNVGNKGLGFFLLLARADGKCKTSSTIEAKALPGLLEIYAKDLRQKLLAGEKPTATVQVSGTKH